MTKYNVILKCQKKGIGTFVKYRNVTNVMRLVSYVERNIGIVIFANLYDSETKAFYTCMKKGIDW